MAEILLLSHTHAFGAFRVGSHHLSREFSRLGHQVTHLSTPESLAHLVAGRSDRERAVVASRSPIRDSDGVTHVVPKTLLPAGMPPRLLGLSRRGRFDVIMIDQPLLWSPRLRQMTRCLVYRPTDEYPGGVKAVIQREILRHCDAVVATSQRVLDQLGTIDRPSLVLPNGVEYERFAADQGVVRGKRAVYVGAIDGRFDPSAIDLLARYRPDWEFVIAGGRLRDESLPNVSCLGPVPYEQVPALLQGAQIGLLPLSYDPLNEGRSPMKLYEYLAAGLRVVARRTPSIAADMVAGIYAYSTHEDLLAVFDRATAEGSSNTMGQSAALAVSWQSRARMLRDFLVELGGFRA